MLGHVLNALLAAAPAAADAEAAAAPQAAPERPDERPSVSLLASYDVTEVRASPATSPIASTGERRIGHAALLGVGVGFL